MKDSFYLDYAAATPVLPEVVSAMMPFFTETFANPSSIHAVGRSAKKAVRLAREQISTYLGADEIVFTGSATESVHLALYGFMKARGFKGHIITTTVEHKAVLATCKELESLGVTVTYVPVGVDGVLVEADLLQVVQEDTCLVSIGYVHSVTGIKQPLSELFPMVKAKGDIVCHSDVTQALAYYDCALVTLGADMVSGSGAKCYGPKGIGFLATKTDVALAPVVVGGGQEQGLRSGTENVPGIVGLAQALKVAGTNGELQRRRDLVTAEKAVFVEYFTQLEDTLVLGTDVQTSPHILGVWFIGADPDLLLAKLDQAGVYVSGGSACSSGSVQIPQEIDWFTAGLTKEQQKGAFVRFSFSFLGTDVQAVMTCLEEVL